MFDRTPLDYLAYTAATGADPSDEASAAALRPAFASLDLLVITLITPETEQVLPAAEMPGLRSQTNDALLELVYDDPLNAWEDIPVLELTGPLDSRLDAVLAALGQSRVTSPAGTKRPEELGGKGNAAPYLWTYIRDGRRPDRDALQRADPGDPERASGQRQRGFKVGTVDKFQGREAPVVISASRAPLP